jgi:ribonuclease HIII
LEENNNLLSNYENLKLILQLKGFNVSNLQQIDYGLQFTVSIADWSGKIRIYQNKKGFLKIDQSQLGEAKYAIKIREILEGKKPMSEVKPNESNENLELGFPVIGTDESGKGDYFGPLVSAGVYVDEQSAKKLLEFGVKDSKKLTDNKNIELAEKITKTCKGHFSIVEISPKKYNELYDQFQREGKNLNTLLAWGHAKSMEELLHKVECKVAIADQFADESFIINKLQERGKKLELIQAHKAEQNVAVAAASVLARATFLEKLSELSNEYGIEFPKGASSTVVECAKKFIGSYGKESLRNVAKLHFKTTNEIFGNQVVETQNNNDFSVNIKKQRQEANDLRKKGNFQEALPIYRDLWINSKDKFDGAGLLHCLRKLELFDEALPLADELISLYPSFNWCRLEVIWTYISGKLRLLNDGETLENVVNVAQRIMNLNPDELAAKMVVFKVLDSAKEINDWKIVNEWVVKINPVSLSSKPIIVSGKEGWSDQARWYNFRINGLLKSGNLKDSITLAEEASEHFPKQKKFFLRLKASALRDLGDLLKSEKIYESLCSGPRPDWWLLHEYSKVVNSLGRKEESLKIMYSAARSNPKLELMVSLFEDIGMLCKELDRFDEARDHLVLLHFIRLKNGWSFSQPLLGLIMELNEFASHKAPSSLTEAKNVCYDYWTKLLGKDSSQRENIRERRKPRKGLSGNVILKDSSPFCFIKLQDQESVFCYKSDLPFGTQDGDLVIFDAFPSFDKKKNRDSWKASNIRV